MAMPWIYETEDGSYEVNPRMRELLTSTDLADEELAVVAVVGRARTGKSFLMNRCVLALEPGSEKGFKVSGTVNSCTKGLWVYPEAVRLPGGGPRALVVDSEGLSSTDSSTNHDASIFALTLLLSSFFLYNTVGSIDEAAIADLGVVTDVVQQVGATEADMPYFLWVVRDFTLELKQRGRAGGMTPDEYLERELAGASASSNSKCRELVRRYFPERSCRTLVRPCASEADLRRVSSLPDRRVRNAFLSGVGDLREHLGARLRPKSVRGQAVTGRILAQLADTHVRHLNAGRFPEMSDALPLLAAARDRRLSESLLARVSASATPTDEAAACLEEWLRLRSGEKAQPLDMGARLQEAAESAAASARLRAAATLLGSDGAEEDGEEGHHQPPDLSLRMRTVADQSQGCTCLLASAWAQAASAAEAQEEAHRRRMEDAREAADRERARLQADLAEEKAEAARQLERLRADLNAERAKVLNAASAGRQQADVLESRFDALMDRWAQQVELSTRAARALEQERTRYAQLQARLDAMAEIGDRAVRRIAAAEALAEGLEAKLAAEEEARVEAEARAARLEERRASRQAEKTARADSLIARALGRSGADDQEKGDHEHARLLERLDKLGQAFGTRVGCDTSTK